MDTNRARQARRIVWSKKCVEAIGDHVAFVSMDSPIAAERWAIEVFRRVEALLEFPESGRRSPRDGSGGIRELIIDSKFILTYKIAEKQIRILAFFHAAQSR